MKILIRLLEFIESNSGLITLILAVATVWLAISTRAVAKATRKIFDLEARPFLVFSKPVFRLYVTMKSKDDHTPVNQKIKVGLEFKNSSRVPLKYDVEKINYTFDSRTIEDPKFHTSGGILISG